VLVKELKVDGYFLELDSPRAGKFAPLGYLPPYNRLNLGLVTTKQGRWIKPTTSSAVSMIASKIVALDQLGIGPQRFFPARCWAIS
jgi:5-methyltetrahydropteroyltriglutamate--homocysteine methyltransferase